MDCTGCGKHLTKGASVCLYCGTPVPRRQDALVYAGASPSVSMLPEDAIELPEKVAPSSPYHAYRETAPPPPPVQFTNPHMLGITPSIERENKPRRTRLYTILAMLAIVLVAGAGTLGARLAFASGAAHLITGGGVADTTHTRCQIPKVDPIAQSHVGAVQTTTGLRDPDHRDFTPIDAVTTFHVGTVVYATFTLITDDQGTITSEWCLGSQGYQVKPYPLSISPGMRGVNAYFTLRDTDASDVGPSVLVIKWNDLVASVVPFTLVQAKP